MVDPRFPPHSRSQPGDHRQNLIHLTKGETVMAAHFAKKESDRRRPAGLLLAGAFAAGVLALTGAGVYAALDATATGTASVSSGTLSLTLANGTGSVGFPQTITNMAPGDVVNTYVDLSNGAGLAGAALTLSVSGTGTTLLTTSAAKGLAVAINQCSVAWTATTGVCSGTTTALGSPNSDPVATLSGTPNTLVSGAVATSALYHLQVSLSLPNQSETTVNGTPPTPTIQGLSTTLTYTFGENQRAATTTNE
jgi:spore coat-associated protein N